MPQTRAEKGRRDFLDIYGSLRAMPSMRRNYEFHRRIRNRGLSMTDLLWCPACEDWREDERSIFRFGAPACEECGTELEDDHGPGPVEVDYKDVDISYKFKDGEDDSEDDTESEDSEAEAEAEAEADGEAE